MLLAWWLEEKAWQNAKFPVSNFLACANPARTADWMAWYRKQFGLRKMHCLMKAGF
jgi:hypothetical protein